MLRMLVVVLLFVSVSAQADFTGNWIGPGVYTNHDEEKIEFELKAYVTETATLLKIEENAFGNTYTFEINDGKLYLNGQAVGEISATMLKLKYLDDADAGCYQSFMITKSDTGLNYEDDYSCDGGYFDNVKAELKK
ncbi:MAG: hypothetical protein AB7F59_07310 [Bdellovibrionales bacterium]